MIKEDDRDGDEDQNDEECKFRNLNEDENQDNSEPDTPLKVIEKIQKLGPESRPSIQGTANSSSQKWNSEPNVMIRRESCLH